MKGIGTDIIEIDRIIEMKNKERFSRKILSVEEFEQFLQFKNEKRQNEFLAGRWAVKEALYKALGSDCEGKAYQDFCILNDKSGKPYLAKPLIENIHISLSHCHHYVVAFVIAE